MFRVTHTPPFNFLLDDLLTHNLKTIAAHLDVSVRTLERWQAVNEAPRMALLSLFYESRWGYSVIETTAHNGEFYARQMTEALKRENAALRVRIARLEKLGQFGSANEPMHSVSGVRLTTGFLSNPGPLGTSPRPAPQAERRPGQ